MSGDPAIRVVLADDQAVVRAGLRVVLEAAPAGSDEPGAPPIEVVGEADSGPAAQERVAELAPDVVLMDVRMPGGDGLAATEHILAAGTAVRVLVVTTFDVDEYVHRALRAGASGFVLKDADPADLVAAVRTVHSGHALLSPTVTTRLVADWVARAPSPPTGSAAVTAEPGPELTGREHDVLVLVARGLSNAEAAAEMTVAESTVKTHVAHLLRKLGCRDRVQLVVHAYEHGVVRAR